MRGFLTGLFLALIFSLLQTGFFSGILLWGVVPNLVLLASLCLMYFGGIKCSFWFAFFAGVFLDAFSQGCLGVTSVLLLVVLIAFSFVLDVFGRKAVIFCFFTFFSSLAFRAIFSFSSPNAIFLLKEAILTTSLLLVFYYPFYLLRAFLMQKPFIQLKMRY